MIGVIGSGSWATALVKILLEKKSQTLNWWVRDDATRQSLVTEGHNPRHLATASIDTSRTNISTNLATVVATSDLLLLALPAAYVADTLGQLPADTYRGHRFISAVKGFVPQEAMSVSQYLEHKFLIPSSDICVVSGPSHAEEVVEKQPTFLTIASRNRQLADDVAQMLRCPYIHTSTFDEVTCLELCGLAKNVYAIAAGIAIGCGYGDNLLAVLTTAAARELQGLIPVTVPTTQFLGDLMVTCFSRHSRNRALGEALARGTSADEHFKHTRMVAEGFHSADVMHRLSLPAPTPIADAVYRILHESTNPKLELEHLIDNVF